MAKAYIGVGSNIDPLTNIKIALVLLKKEVKVINTSTFYKTKPLYNIIQSDYLNGVWEIVTDIEPEALKYNVLQFIEDKTGRLRSEDKNSSRTIDLDLLLYEDCVINSETIILPDPGIYTRNFIAVPLFELNNELIIPDTGRKIRDIVQCMSTEDFVKMFEFTDELLNIITRDNRG